MEAIIIEMFGTTPIAAALVIISWKLDKRITIVETKMEGFE